MFELLYAKIADPRTLIALLIGALTVASLISIGLPFLEGDNLEERMKLVASERERIRAREREKMKSGNGGGSAGAQGLHEEHRRPLQPVALARHRGSEAKPADGQLTRPSGGNRLPVLPPRHADRRAARRLVLRVRDHQHECGLHDADRRRALLRLCWPENPGTLYPERDLQSSVDIGAPSRTRWTCC